MQVDEETLFFLLLDYSVLVDPAADPVIGVSAALHTSTTRYATVTTAHSQGADGPEPSA
jgi:hypothetical protein